MFCISTMVLVLMSAYCGSRVVSVISERLPIVRKRCIVIDAGHGGEDGGATSWRVLTILKYPGGSMICCIFWDMKHE